MPAARRPRSPTWSSSPERGLPVVDTVNYTFDDLERAYDDLRAGRIVSRRAH
ncbi:hypothetical protein [Blastococcus sp. URHD0036]|uniref:hypothetical protein n=1 Tax=Blastococcus sp. URHD0036 TaxID=1380356 RepID=UPI0012DE5884|nr:hypothetical protein [Blastococcus sp. URHD0036]